MAKATYKDAGVDLEKYADAMARLPRLVSRTHTPRVMRLDGGFAGLFQLDFPGALFARRYKSPVLIACTDGVGTKLKIASAMGVHNTVGIDLVAMCVNDAVCCGAEPLFFLDYVALPKDDPPLLEQLVEGITEGCLQSDCALIGGETAILPDVYGDDDYDMAGFSVGAVEKSGVIDGKAIAPGDVVIGIASTGVHSNGFSLVRKVVFDMAKLNVTDHVDELGATVGETLLTPTQIYVRPLRAVLMHYRVKQVVHGIAHITGGGLHENIERILPNGVRVLIERDSWKVPAVFPWLQRLGDIEADEMARVFNMGVGMAIIASAYYADSIRHQLSDLGMASWVIGRVEAGEKGVAWA